MTCKLNGGGAFLHVPKTGGTWVQTVLRKNKLAGMQLGQEHSWGRFMEPWAFCVFRNPVHWWLSLWRYRCETNFCYVNPGHVLHDIQHIHSLDPVIFISRAMREARGLCGKIYEKFAENTTYILHTETLSDELLALGRKVGWGEIDVNVPKQNTTKPRPLPIGMGGILKDLVASEREAHALWKRHSNL